MKVFGCIAHYGVAALLAFLMGAVLGGIPLFKEAMLWKTQLSASEIVQFIGYTGALIFMGMMGRRLTLRMPKNGKWIACLRPVVTPMVTLIIIMGAYAVIPIIGRPLVVKMGIDVYNWIFIVGSAGAAMWLTMAWLVQSGTIIHSLEGARKGAR